MLGAIWATASKDELLAAFPGRTAEALCIKAGSMGLSGKGARGARARRGSLCPLMEDTDVAWYWLGFILADGHITKNGQVVVMLSDKDEDHLSCLANFLGSSVRRPYNKPDRVYAHFKHLSPEDSDALARTIVRVAVMESKVAPMISARLGLKSSRKTYNPPCLDAMEALTPTQLECLFMGFFDGDGTTGARWASIEVHGSWEPFLSFLRDRGFVLGRRPHSVGGKYVTVTVPASKLRSLHSRYGACLPLLRRKWIRWSQPKSSRMVIRESKDWWRVAPPASKRSLGE